MHAADKPSQMGEKWKDEEIMLIGSSYNTRGGTTLLFFSSSFCFDPVCYLLSTMVG